MPFCRNLMTIILDLIPSDSRLNCTSFMMCNDSLAKPEQTIVDSLDFLDDFYLVPINEAEILPDPDHCITLDVVMDNFIDGISYSFFNSVSYVQPKMPTLMTILTSGDNVTDAAIYGTNTNTFVLVKEEIVEIVVKNLDTGTHPFHMHGHVFQTIVRDKTYDAESKVRVHILIIQTIILISLNIQCIATLFSVDHNLILLSNLKLIIQVFGSSIVTLNGTFYRIWLLSIVEGPLSIQTNYFQQLTQNYIDVCARSNFSIKGNTTGNHKAFFNLQGESIQPKWITNGFTKKGIIAMTFSCLEGILGSYYYRCFLYDGYQILSCVFRS